MTLLPVVVTLLCVVAGATLQRVSGMGMGMIAAPTLTLLFGPVAGVSMSNVAASASALVLMLLLRRDVDWGRFARLAPLLVAGSFVGAAAVRLLDRSWLQVVLGASVLLAIAAALGLQRRFTAQGRGAALTAGAVGGFMNTTAGIAGPALAVYAVASRWEHRSWAATLQPILLLANLTSIVTKSLLGTAGFTAAVTPGVWVAAVAGVPVGVGLGALVARRVSAGQARTVALAVAGLSGLIALTRGVVGLLG